jgi:hypothetical protein
VQQQWHACRYCVLVWGGWFRPLSVGEVARRCGSWWFVFSSRRSVSCWSFLGSLPGVGDECRGFGGIAQNGLRLSVHKPS